MLPCLCDLPWITLNCLDLYLHHLISVVALKCSFTFVFEHQIFCRIFKAHALVSLHCQMVPGFFFFFFNAEYLDVHANILGPYEILFFYVWFSSKEMVKCSGIDSPNSSRDCLFMDSYIEMAENTDRHVSFSMCSKWNCICTINSPKRQAEHAGFIFKVGFLWLNIHRHKSPYHHFALSVLTFFLMDPSKTGQIPWHSMLDSKLFLWLDSAILSAFSTLWKS